jgi:hypothetical protein
LNYDPTTIDVLRRAWVLAEQLQHRTIDNDHIAVAVSSAEGVDLKRVRQEAMARLGRIDTDPTAAEAATLLASDAVVNLILAANQIAQARNEPEPRSVQPSDLCQALLAIETYRGDGSAAAAEAHLSAGDAAPVAEPQPAAIPDEDIGTWMRRIDRAVRDIQKISNSSGQTASRGRTEVRRLTKIVETVHTDLSTAAGSVSNAAGPLSALVDRLPDTTASVGQCLTQLQAFDPQLTQISGELRQVAERLNGIQSPAPSTDAPPAFLLQSAGDVQRRLTSIDERSAEILELIPRPPGRGPLGIGIAAILLIGASAGLALSMLAGS